MAERRQETDDQLRARVADLVEKVKAAEFAKRRTSVYRKGPHAYLRIELLRKTLRAARDKMASRGLVEEIEVVNGLNDEVSGEPDYCPPAGGPVSDGYDRCRECDETLDRCRCGRGVWYWWDDEYAIPDPSIAMRSIRVVFSDPQYTFGTSINGTRAEIAKYYMGALQVGTHDTDERTALADWIEFANQVPGGAAIRTDLRLTRARARLARARGVVKAYGLLMSMTEGRDVSVSVPLFTLSQLIDDGMEESEVNQYMSELIVQVAKTLRNGRVVNE